MRIIAAAWEYDDTFCSLILKHCSLHAGAWLLIQSALCQEPTAMATCGYTVLDI